MISFAAGDVNSESCGPLLGELLLDPPSHRRERVEGLPAGVDAGQVVEAFQIINDIVRIGARAHVWDSQEVHELWLGHEFGKVDEMEFFVQGSLLCRYRS